ncbi:hypothetical protein J6590_041465 [Homalodisca vitripennis]|nr:hypothetical protein J6590_041465 [Homalodisca vitripennis]
MRKLKFELKRDLKGTHYTSDDAIEKEDGLPSLICHSCLFNVERSLNFKNQCEQADSMLRSFIRERECEENQINEIKHTSCQAEVLKDNLDYHTQPSDLVKETEEKHENTGDLNDSDNVEVDENNLNKTEENEEQVNTEVNATPKPEAAFEVEEGMNDVEEGMFGSEPFSLDLCSVRLQSECQDDQDADMVLYPSTQFTDEDQWSDSASDISLYGPRQSPQFERAQIWTYRIIGLLPLLLC